MTKDAPVSGFSLAALLTMTARARLRTGTRRAGRCVRKLPPTVAIDMALDATTQNALAGALIGTIAPFAPLEESGMRLRVSASWANMITSLPKPVSVASTNA